jgi:exopolysaccharide biosynthesis polyprenyl glycosylphosphotransferase
MIVIAMAYGVSFIATGVHQNIEYMAWYGFLLASFCIVFFLFMMVFRMYNMSTFFYWDRVIRNTTLSVLGTAGTIFVFLFMAYNTVFSRLFLLVFIMLSLASLNIGKFALLKMKKRSVANEKVIYVGNKMMYEKFIKYMKLSGYHANILGYINVNGPDVIHGVTCLGQIGDFEEILRANPCDNVVFTQSLTERPEIEQYLSVVNEMGITSKVLLDVYKLDRAKWYVSSLGTYPMLTYYNVTLDPVALGVKRAIDIAGALAGIVLTLPLMAVTAALIKLESKGPVVFRQKRVGRNGQTFYIYKFRSMYKDAESRLQELMAQNEMGGGGKIFKMKDDPRITKVGKFIRKASIDELPQFFNVLKGSMSLVGTRPPTVGEVAEYDRWHHRRISIRPGITGIWQTSGRNEVKDFDKIVQMDIQYIENWSLALDVILILKTAKVLVSKTGAQ